MVGFLLLRAHRFLLLLMDFFRFEKKHTRDWKNFSCWQYQALGSSVWFCEGEVLKTEGRDITMF